jgi:hypothetical protein
MVLYNYNIRSILGHKYKNPSKVKKNQKGSSKGVKKKGECRVKRVEKKYR